MRHQGRGKIIEQVHGILAGERVGFEVSDDGRRFNVPVPDGSAAVEIDFEILPRGANLIRLRALVLRDVEVDADNRLEILEHLNALNQTALFGRFYLDADRASIVLQHELLGDDLDAGELLNAVTAVGASADQTDDELQLVLGTGVRAIELSPDVGSSQAGAAGPADPGD